VDEAIASQSRLPRWGAVAVSDLVPGLGQALSGRITVGAIWFIGCYAAAGIAVWLAASRLVPGVIAAFCAGGFAALVWIGMLVHAYRSTRSTADDAAGRPWLAAFLSCLFPGLGQFYNRDIMLGLLFLGISGGVSYMPEVVQAVALYVIQLWSIIQAYRSRVVKEHVPLQGSRVLVLAWVGHMILFVITFLGIRTLFVQPFRIPTAGMEPTLRGDSKPGAENPTRGDHIFVDKLVYRFSSPHRGDIVVFRTDEIPDLARSPRAAYYVKRIAGLPGERVSIQPPYLCINGQRVTDPPIFETIASGKNGYSGFVLIHDFGGSQYLASETNSVQLGDDEYFVLGDNSPSSLDSRFWGPVPRRSIVGRVTKVYWPSDRMGIIPE